MNNTTLNLISQKVGEIADHIETINSELGALVIRVTAIEKQMRFFLHLQEIFFLVLLGVAAVSIFNLILLRRKEEQYG